MSDLAKHKRIVVTETYIIDKIAQTAKCQDEKVDFLNEDSLARLIGVVEVVLDLAAHGHDCVRARHLQRAPIVLCNEAAYTRHATTRVEAIRRCLRKRKSSAEPSSLVLL